MRRLSRLMSPSGAASSGCGPSSTGPMSPGRSRHWLSDLAFPVSVALGSRLAELADPDRHPQYIHQPGLWGKGFDETGAPVREVDLIVGTLMSGGGRRAPRSMAAHGKISTRTAPGIELAALDRDLMPIESFTDTSVRDAYVAGTAALLCAKAPKLGERVHARTASLRDRVLAAKDAGDMWRLMAASDPRAVAETFVLLSGDEPVGSVARTGVDHLRRLVSSRELLRLSRTDMNGKTDPDDIDETCTTWTSAFFATIDRPGR